MDTYQLLKINKTDIINIASSYGASQIRVFGSVARGEAKEDSDIDLLVTLEKGRSLLDLIGLIQDLEELLTRKVDVITDQGINPYLKQHILSEAKPL